MLWDFEDPPKTDAIVYQHRPLEVWINGRIQYAVKTELMRLRIQAKARLPLRIARRTAAVHVVELSMLDHRE